MTPSSAPVAAPVRIPDPPPRARRPGSSLPVADPRLPLPSAPGLLAEGSALLRVPSPVGRLELVAEGDQVVALSIATAGMLPLDHLDDRPSPVLAETARQLDEHFAGRRTSFDVPVRLTGTPFQVAVWEALIRIPHGGVTTYGALAQAAGRPGGARAVGGAVGANRLCILVPCHRVLGSNGRVTGFSAGDGVATKVRLLALEGSVLS
ncbi:methylated-DNA-[protein]-cysteine S-methyltransferase [Clavibacter michiganensis]|uniref:methylated-DNA--[protein]-cysteine S-methyltransferase n=1 Tax=Clavibacter michiganensis TaxID=28447 RepID=UPI001AE0F919|nr:methylated-DNA--[protein]-cysteine S-methyltransferase [Clavibacter michiganensis]MBP2457860.1 methylated-DNA-[protein]-cysteine S-methyltransferase [Clavibacter michiganensis]MDQ0410430.1 methylated-DNA-[protein]-cysteine S-methyltransferase [Clavibacter michiganensis]